MTEEGDKLNYAQLARVAFRKGHYEMVRLLLGKGVVELQFQSYWHMLSPSMRWPDLENSPDNRAQLIRDAATPIDFFFVGIVHSYGIAGYPVDHEIAFQMFEKAARKGHHYALFELAVYYRDGYANKRDLKHALSYCKLAAESGVAPAMFMLGGLYEYGFWSVH